MCILNYTHDFFGFFVESLFSLDQILVQTIQTNEENRNVLLFCNIDKKNKDHMKLKNPKNYQKKKNVM